MADPVVSETARWRTLSGGTRTQVSVERPWQPRLIFPASREACPFCRGTKETGEYSPGPGWRMLQDAFTPHVYHRLLVPTECWTEERLRSLGGVETVAMALRYALDEAAQGRATPFPTWIGTHVGHGAGQNLAHHHWHIFEPAMPLPLVMDLPALRRNNDEILRGSASFVVAAYGVRAGQMIILPRPELDLPAAQLFRDVALVQSLAHEIHRLVTLFNNKFRHPDYMLLLALQREDEWHVRYTPILNQWGMTEYAAIDYGTPFDLPWPHAATVQFLQS